LLQKSRNKQKQTNLTNRRATRSEVFLLAKGPKRLPDTEKGIVLPWFQLGLDSKTHFAIKDASMLKLCEEDCIAGRKSLVQQGVSTLDSAL